AVVLATAIACAAMFVLRALCPVGGATALVVALGSETANWDGLWRITAGIVLVTVLGEGARLAILHHRRLLSPS
ncbi:MAG: HPP family protein, partial [Gluconacetobacter diazotrophicus]|nr:HPP family protein [Gluconacetobacter diazotrophicus]